MIDWKGNYARSKPSEHPSVEEFKDFFEELYMYKDSKEVEKIRNLQSQVNIPLLDDPFSGAEIEDALSSMKKGGFDYNLPVLAILIGCFSNTMLCLLNFIFFIRYPIQLALSLLSVIPKKGDMQLPKNYRGIQMLRAVSSLYDRLITNRIHKWMYVEPEQSAFQKGKSAIIQIFIIRILIEMAKKMNLTLYIAFVDLEKAFDKVSRFHLLSKLVARGIGCFMLEALKNIYSHTLCIVHFYGCFSDHFTTFSGIRQGSASSVLLFIIFMDGLFPYLRQYCDSEQLLRDFHALVHADDTILISTSRVSFIIKCNHMIDYFDENKLTLNLEKSSYLIIKPKELDRKISLRLKNGYLKYKATQSYLGVIITDKGNLKHDVSSYIKGKRSNVLFKFVNFCSKNFMAPFYVKLQVLDTCVASSLIYACETWADNGNQVEVIYRNGLRTVLGVRPNINNEIIYVESNRFPLKCKIKRQQLKFWTHVKEYIDKNPGSALDLFLKKAREINLPYIRYYENLECYISPTNCLKTFENEFKEKWKLNFETASNDSDIRMGTYLPVNPTLSKPLYHSDLFLETDRLILTRFRCGSHSLLIEKGRFTKIPREERLCVCNMGVQTVLHCFTQCPLTLPLLEKSYKNLQEIFEDNKICILLHRICNKLKISF